MSLGKVLLYIVGVSLTIAVVSFYVGMLAFLILKEWQFLIVCAIVFAGLYVWYLRPRKR